LKLTSISLGLCTAISTMAVASESEGLDYGFWVDWSSRHTSRGRDYLDGSGAFSQGIYVGVGHFGFELDRSGAIEDGTKELNFDLYYFREFDRFSFHGASEYSDWTSTDFQVGGSSLSFGGTYFDLPAGLWVAGDVEYSIDRNGFFSEVSVGADIEPYDWLTLTPSLSVGFNNGYVENGHDGLNHAVANLSADFMLSDHFKVTASAAYNWAINRESDFVRYSNDAILRDFFWTGLSVSVWRDRERRSERSASLQERCEVTFGTSAWATALSGAISIGDDSPGAVQEIDDAYNQVHTGLSIEVSRGRWSLLVDGSYASFGAEVEPLLSIFAPTPVDVQLASVDLAAGYRVIDSDSASVDFLAGLRYNHLKTEYEFGSPESSELNWIDPSIGVRARMKLRENLEFSTRAEFGGFEVGSDQYWQIDIGLGYQLTDHLSVELRYQHLELDYTQHDNDVNFTFKGPKIGASYRF
jgi:opacity protein-like surface antigen